MRTAALFLTFAATAFAVSPPKDQPAFQTSDRCLACHNDLKTASGRDASIGFAWRASIMANSSRDPYWQASVRRETIDHPQIVGHIEDECSVCHMPVTRYEARLKNREGRIFEHLPFDTDHKDGREAADGVDCSICHQISADKLGTRESFNGGFVINTEHHEYGPYDVERGQQRIMQSSTSGWIPEQKSDHIRKSELCATCHTLYTTAFDANGKPAGTLPEQVPYQEWLHSDYRATQTCQDCHMPANPEPVPITRVFGAPREGTKQHVFVAANFFMQRMLNRYRDDLDVAALPEELESAAAGTVDFLQQKSARLTIENATFNSGRLRATLLVENRNGHKLPTAYPARRAWLHVTVRDARGQVVFESGAQRPDGSIVGNDNDADPARFEPHYNEITAADQVQIYEDILGDPQGRVTTGLLQGVRFLKDNRLLPRGFDKNTADPDVKVVGAALSDPDFTGGADRVHYNLALSTAGPVTIEAELRYQPIGYRWAHNLEPYTNRPEPQRFVNYYKSMSTGTAAVLASDQIRIAP